MPTLTSAQALFLTNNAIIVHEFATGYILEDTSKKWDDRMHILINVSSSFMVANQAISKTAFGFTLLRLSNQWQKWVLWFAIGSMNLWMILRVFFQWARVCDKKNYQEPWRLGFCIRDSFRDDFKEGGNGEFEGLQTTAPDVPRGGLIADAPGQSTMS